MSLQTLPCHCEDPEWNRGRRSNLTSN